MTDRQPDKKRRWIIGIAVLLLLLLLLFLLWLTARSRQMVTDRDAAQEQATVLTGTHSGTTDTMADSVASAADDTLLKKGFKRVTKTMLQHPVVSDSGPLKLTVSDTAAADSDAVPGDSCSRDTVLPWVYPDPSGGLHRKPVEITLVANKPCVVEWRRSSADTWQRYRGGTVPMRSSGNLEYRALDSCGKSMEPRTETYEIKPVDKPGICPDDMEYVKIGSKGFCIDRYEWPNRKGTKPRTFTSLYQAADSCFSAGKRLCTSEEWSMACSGPYGWHYPYGDRYESRACVTKDTAAHSTGSKPECRGYFEIFDMSGNVAEWTSSRSRRNDQYNDVAGGFWESGSQSGCKEMRYSYFPQNKHNPVGFRCCKGNNL